MNFRFNLDQETGQVTLAKHLDREKKDLYLFSIEARDLSGAGELANYTQLMINVLGKFDNAVTNSNTLAN